MSTSYCLLDVPVKETIGDNDTTYFFQREEHAKCLLENLSEMQFSEEGVLTDIVVCTGSKDYEEKLHSMLLAACSPVVKKRLVERASRASDGSIVLKEMTKELLEFFRDFIYKSTATLDTAVLNLDDLFNFAVKYDIEFLQRTCKQCKDSQSESPVMEVVFHDHEDVLLGLFEMFLEKELTTTVLEDNEGKTQFQVHGPVIAAASPILQEVLLDGLSSGDSNKIRLEISPVALGVFIEYIYSAKVTLQHQNVAGLLKAACTYETPALAKVCCDWLIARLDTHDDVVGILCLARELDSEYTEELEEVVKSCIVANFSELSAEENFNSLPYEGLKEIIEDDDLDIKTEEDVLGVVLKWIEWDEDSRLSFTCDILPSIRLELTSIEFLDAMKYDPRFKKCARCLQEIDRARQKLEAAMDKSYPTSVVTGQEDYDRATEAGFDDARSLPRFSWTADEDGRDDVSSVPEQLYRGPPPPDFRHSSEKDTRETPRRRDGRPGVRFRENRELFWPRENGERALDPFRDDQDAFDDTSSYQGNFLDDYDRISSVSAPFYRNSLPRGTPDDYQPRQRGRRKDGQPDMRFKENRKQHLEERAPGPLKKDGTPDMRFKVNKEAFGHNSGRATQRVSGPLKKNGTPDMRFKENKAALMGFYPRSSAYSSTSGSSLPRGLPHSAGPLRKDGLPDMRFKENKEALKGSYPRSSFCSSVSEQSSVGVSFSGARPPSVGCYVGPVKKNGTPDMRYEINKQLYGVCSMTSSTRPRGLLKKNGAPDMRYAVNKHTYGSTPPSSMARGPLKKDGTPDMRFKANRR